MARLFFTYRYLGIIIGLALLVTLIPANITWGQQQGAQQGEVEGVIQEPEDDDPVEPPPEHNHSGHDHALSDEYWADLAQGYEPYNVDLEYLRAVASLLDAQDVGEWGPVINWPHVPVSASNLPNGDVLTWASNQRSAFPGGQPEFTYTATWDPITGTFQEIPYAGHDMFCASLGMLEDGRVFVNGGRNTVVLTSWFDYNTSSWVPTDPMNDPRWYPTTLVLPGDKVFTASGSGGPTTAEVWTPEQGWQMLNGINWSPIVNSPGFETNWWPYLTLMADGNLLHAGPTEDMHIIDPAGQGSMVNIGPRFPGNDWYPKHGAVVMYDEGKLLVAGGATGPEIHASTNRAFVVDFSSPTPQVTETAPMAFARRFQNPVMLPTGEVLIIGGNTSGTKFSDDGTILAAEIWNPDTQTFRTVASMSVPRNYHSVALMMTDGRVLSAGGGLCDCAADHQDGQIYSPPYLFNPDGSLATRPVISQAPSTIGYGQTFTVDVVDNIEKFSLIKMSATTHAVNTDQRYLSVPFSDLGGGQYELTSHTNMNVLTPGYWMLFAVNDQGVPSESAIIQVSTTGAPDVEDPGNQVDAEESSISLQINATDPNGDTLTYGAAGLPAGLSIDANSGLISGVLATGSSGSYQVSVTVGDGNSTVQIHFNWVVTTGATGDILREWWTGIAGTTINDLTGDPNYPDNPAGQDTPPSFEAPTDWADNYGTRMRGYIHPAVSGNYTFWISSDDNGELWLSSDQNPANATMIANVPSWSSSQQWDKFPEQQSAVISLQAGQKYYIEALQKEGGGGDNLAVAWQPPGGAQEVIGGAYLSAYTGANTPPTLTNPGDQTNSEGEIVSLALQATDVDGDNLTFSASGLPAGLGIDAATGLVSGTLPAGSAGAYAVAVTVDDGSAVDSVSFNWTVNVFPPLLVDPIVSPPIETGTNINYNANAGSGTNPVFRWDFGDGTPETSNSSSPSINHIYAQPGRYTVTMTASDDSGAVVVIQFIQAVHNAQTAGQPSISMSVLYEVRVGNDRVWNVNPDNDSVSVFDAVAHSKVTEIAVGDGPRSLAIAPDGSIWVTNKHSATISVIDPVSLNVVQTLALPAASQPYGLVFDPAGSEAYVTLEATGQLLRLNPLSGAQSGSVDVGPNPRHVSTSGDGAKIFVSRFVTPHVPGEETANPQTEIGGVQFGGEVVVVDAASLSVSKTIVLQHSDKPDAANGGRGIPNYLGPAVIAPDGQSAWVPSKQDNIKRGVFRDGNELTHDSTVRSITSRIDLASENEDYPARLDHDDGSVPNTGLFGPYGNYLFVALEGSREIAVIDPYGESELFRFGSGRAPQGIAMSQDGLTLYVHNFMDRTVTVHDISNLINEGNNVVTAVATYDTVANETLTAQVLLGKQLFYDASDPRLAFQEYLSCAGCHNDGGQDGRIWDLTGFGEGLRNTVELNGRAGIGHGPLHWSANFDEVQDFEVQIRNLSGGLGLMDDNDFNTHFDPLGLPKAGLSSDLDALAAYLGSLDTFARSPYRNSDGTLTADGLVGQALFQSAACSSCHTGTNFTDSAPGNLHDIGTITAASGNRLDGPLTGLDTPTLRGVWATTPFLHTGTVTTLKEAIQAHNGVLLTDGELDLLVSYLQQIDDLEPAPPNIAPTITNPGDQTSTEGDSVSLTIDANDAEGNNLTFSANGLPSALTIDASSGLISGILPFDSAGTYAVTVEVSDGTDTVGAAFSWTINQGTPPADFPWSPLLDDFNRPDGSIGANWSGNTSGSSISAGQLAVNNSGEQDIYWNGTSFGPDQEAFITMGNIDAGAREIGLVLKSQDINDFVAGLIEVFYDPGSQVVQIWTYAPGQNWDKHGANISVSFADGDQYGARATSSGDVEVYKNGSFVDSRNVSGWPFASGGGYVGLFNLNAAGVTVDDFGGGNVSGPNAPPTITNPGNQTNTEGDSVSLFVTANDDDGDSLTFSAVGLPPSLGIGSSTGEIAGNIDAGSAGTYNATVTVDDGLHTADANFTWTVNPPPNTPPTITNPGNQTNIEGDSVSLFVAAIDDDGDSLTFSATGLPPSLGISSSTGEIAGNIDAGSAGSYNVTVTVDDGVDTADALFTWTVNPPPNTPPTITNPGLQVYTEGDSVSLFVTANDDDGDSLTFSATGLPPSLGIDSGTGEIAGTIDAASAGTYNATVTVDDGVDTADANFTWTVNPPPNTPPTITNPGPQISTEGDGVGLFVAANDDDGDSLTFSATGLPPSLGIDSSSGEIAGSIDAGSAGTYNATVTVDDGQDTADANFTWTVNPPPNTPPTITNPGPQISTEGDGISLFVAANDDDGDSLSFSAVGLPPSLGIDSSSGEIAGSIDAGSAGTYNATVTVDDGQDTADANFTWTVNPPPNTPPTITNPGPQISTEGDGISLFVAANDDDGDSLSFSATGLPPSLGINSGTGEIVGTIDAGSAGTYNATVTVDDGLDTADANFTWAVNPAPNTPPTITNPGSQINTEGDSVSLFVAANDDDGDSLTFSATGLPPTLGINSGTGEIFGTIDAGSAGTYNATVTVDDGVDTAGANFTWTVNPPTNTPPTITNPGNQTNTEGDGVSLFVAANDDDGDSLTFSAIGLPPSLGIDSSSGEIAGTIDAGSAGTYNATVTVDDGVDTAGANFTWTVNVSGTNEIIYVSSSSGGNAGGVDFANEDILAYDTVLDSWSMVLDGSDVGLTGGGARDLDAFYIMDDGTILLSITGGSTLPDVGSVDDSDIVRFVPTSLGTTTAGSFELYFDGSDVGLTTNGEGVDAVHVLGDGSLLLSTSGGYDAPNVSGEGEDLILFTPTSLGATTSGSWTIYFDGSDVGLGDSNDEDSWGVWVDSLTGDVYLTARGIVSTTGLSADGADIFVCTPSSLGATTACTFDLYWDGSAFGYDGERMDGFMIVR